ncbi:uncharacterized protein LOC124291411 [Haliotis rubra]|uniref:uncharacterized protein LOC124291411 n=1 Tax=Haliotis rubra TaxID=36100 RepID=UPI001EE509C2|nr:uncharacterized protein LOC124291411 [Haliotis rubra]
MNFSTVCVAVAFACVIVSTMANSAENKDAAVIGPDKGHDAIDHFCKTMDDLGYSDAEKTLTDSVNALRANNENNNDKAVETILQILAVSHIKYCNELEAAEKQE